MIRFYRPMTETLDSARLAFRWWLWCSATSGLSLGAGLGILARYGPDSPLGWVNLAFGLLYLWLVPGTFRHWRRLDRAERLERLHGRG